MTQPVKILLSLSTATLLAGCAALGPSCGMAKEYENELRILYSKAVEEEEMPVVATTANIRYGVQGVSRVTAQIFWRKFQQLESCVGEDGAEHSLRMLAGDYNYPWMIACGEHNGMASDEFVRRLKEGKRVTLLYKVLDDLGEIDYMTVGKE